MRLHLQIELGDGQIDLTDLIPHRLALLAPGENAEQQDLRGGYFIPDPVHDGRYSGDDLRRRAHHPLRGGPAQFNENLCKQLNIAGHDAQILSTVMPAAMMFIPSIGGISHHWTENTSDADIAMGAKVFVDACARVLGAG